MKEPTTNDRDVNIRPILFMCELGAVALFWLVQILSGFGGAQPLIYISDPFYFLSLRLYGYLRLLVLINPFVVLFRARLHTALLVIVSISLVILSLFAEYRLFVCVPVYATLAFFAHRSDRRRSAAQVS